MTEVIRAESEKALRLGISLRRLRLLRGWNTDHVAQAARVSRTTLYHLERGEIRRPRASTLHKLARLYQVPVESFDWFDDYARESHSWRISQPALARAGHPPATDTDCLTAANDSIHHEVATARALDRTTNPIVAEFARDRPELFARWSGDDWDELYSQFGVGGPLTEAGVEILANRINRHRETVYRLRIVLETHLADVAAGLVETLYRQVSARTGESLREEPPEGPAGLPPPRQ